MLEVSSLSFQYRYATTFDYVLLSIAIVFSVAQGALNSVSSVIFKGLTNALIVGQAQWDQDVFDYPEFYHNAMNAIYEYTGYGLGVFFLGFISVCYFKIELQKIGF